MPELPEVEAVVRHLAPLLETKVCQGVSMPQEYQKALSGSSAAHISARIKGQEIVRVYRRAKYIVLELSSSHYISIHLRMTGRLLLELEAGDKKYVTAWFRFTDGSKLYFKDVRKFGRIKFHESLDELEAKLGPEPLSAEFTLSWLTKALNKKNRKMKSLLLDQAFIAGLGNIYVDEVLFLAGIHPETPSGSLSKESISKLHKGIKTIIAKAIEFNGTTFQSFYFGEEQSGEFVSYLKVFGRTGEPCRTCKTPIVKIRVAQRGTHLCPLCQPACD